MGVVVCESANFNNEVIQAEVPVIVDFYADWCGPCKMVGPILEELSNEYVEKVKICKVNVDNAHDIASQYGVMSIPALMVFKNGQKVDEIVGAVPKAHLQQLIEKHL